MKLDLSGTLLSHFRPEWRIFTAVRKVSAIFFLLVLLLTQTPLQQVLKIAVLVEHFKEHKAEDNRTSFASFIILHYFSGNPKDKDYDRDMQLPFRADDVVIVSGTVVVPDIMEADFTPSVYEVRHYPLLHTPGLPPRHTFDIFQPPNIG